MAEVLGPLNLLNKALPTGVDGTRLAEWELRDGVTYQELINMVALALGDVNEQLITDWGWLFGITEEIWMEYEQGGSVTPMKEITDTDRPQPTHGETIGHMLPLRAYGEAIGGSRRYFRDARATVIRASISGIVRKGIWQFEQRLLTRLFTNTENAIGGTGYDVPFVRGSGGTVDYAPPAWKGQAFDTTHDHFVGYDDDSLDYSDMLNGLAEHLEEHGFAPPYRAVVSRADVSSYYGLQKFVEMVDINQLLVIDRGGSSSGPQFFSRGTREMGHFGDFQSEWGLIQLHHSARVPTDYAAVVKSYGSNDTRNPLAVRVHPSEGFGFFVVPETTPDDDTPIKQLDVEFEFGVGVGMDRAAAAIGRLHTDGTWVNPTIT